MTDDTRELDIQVAVEVFGWRPMEHKLSGMVAIFESTEALKGEYWKPAASNAPLTRSAYVPHYSTDRHAWLDVVARLEADGYTIALQTDRRASGKRYYDCRIWSESHSEVRGMCITESGFAEGVCRAALKVMQRIKEVS